MVGVTEAATAVSNLLNNAMNTIWPKPEDKAKAEYIQMQAAVLLAESQTRVMFAEASSNDKWTSRARPSFLYVVYTIILWGLPLSLAGIWHPDMVKDFIQLFGHYLDAIPQKLYDLFTYVMLGYVTSRGVEKSIDVIKKK